MQRRAPDSLTPREQQVLALLKRGYSNRDIAAELQISLSGAKYHVSQIISKLGVSTREEAAQWKPPSRRWGFAPLFGGAGSPVSLAAKALVAAVLVVAIAGAAAMALDGDDAPSSGPLSAAAEPSPTPDPCQEQDDDIICHPLVRDRYTTWEEATAATSFPPLVPAYLPAGYEMRELTLMHQQEPDSFGESMEELWAEYYDAAGNRLLVKQGDSSFTKGFYDLAPDEYRGTMRVGTAQVFWFQGFAVYEEREPGFEYPNGEWDPDGSDGAITLFWEDDPTGPVAWEIAPDGTKTYHRSGLPIEHLIYASGLPLEELVKVAESMLQP
jgi:DNA-binding CsgD family transcriptional regulator